MPAIATSEVAHALAAHRISAFQDVVDDAGRLLGDAETLLANGGINGEGLDAVADLIDHEENAECGCLVAPAGLALWRSPGRWSPARYDRLGSSIQRQIGRRDLFEMSLIATMISATWMQP